MIFDAARGRATARPLPWGVFGMLVLVALAALCVARQAHRFMTWIDMDWKVVGHETPASSQGFKPDIPTST